MQWYRWIMQTWHRPRVRHFWHTTTPCLKRQIGSHWSMHLSHLSLMILRMCLFLPSRLDYWCLLQKDWQIWHRFSFGVPRTSSSFPLFHQVLMTDVDHRLSSNTFWVISYYFRSVEKLHGYLRQENQSTSKFQYTHRPVIVLWLVSQSRLERHFIRRYHHSVPIAQYHEQN